jgi:hypothetical protein
MFEEFDNLREEIDIIDLYQEEIDQLVFQNEKLSMTGSTSDLKQIHKNDIVIEYFQKRIDDENSIIQKIKNSNKTVH